MVPMWVWAIGAWLIFVIGTLRFFAVVTANDEEHEGMTGDLDRFTMRKTAYGWQVWDRMSASVWTNCEDRWKCQEKVQELNRMHKGDELSSPTTRGRRGER